MKFRYAIAASLAFILLNTLLIIGEHQSLFIMPIVLIGLLIYLWLPQQFFNSYILLSPLSIPLSEMVSGLNFDLWFPSELMILALSPLSIVLLSQKNQSNRWFTWHPTQLVLYFLVAWMFISTLSSSLPIVSVKYIALKLLYILVLFYLPFSLMVNQNFRFTRMLLMYSIGLIGVIAITLSKQAQLGLFNKFVAHGSCNPYFTDHTSYAAVLALLIPVILSLAFTKKSVAQKLLLFLFSFILIVALVLSYTRAAWLSLMVAFGVWLIWLIKMRFRYVILLAVIFGVIIYSYRIEITVWLNTNKTASSADLKKHVSSIANVRTDESNVERLNRWTSAIRMFREKPVLGWGPGTYMFRYAPFQASYLKTRESSNLGLKGNAHSEYLGMLSESGFPALLAFLLAIGIILFRGFKLAIRLTPNSHDRTLLIGVLLGWISYLVHGLLNNFLDMDKVALLFWGYAAFILSLEYRYSKSNPSMEISSNTSSESRN